MGHAVRKLSDRSTLDFFRRGLEIARSAYAVGGEDEVHARVDELAGQYVYGLSSFFAKQAAGTQVPGTDDELYAMLLEDLYVEASGDARRQYIRLDNGALRVRTDDDEVELAYALVPASVLRDEPDRWAWWMHTDSSLPDAIGDGAYEPAFECEFATLDGQLDDGRGGPRTWAVFLTSYDGSSFGLPRPVVIRGARMDTVGAVLRGEVPLSEGARRWPFELRLLRAMIAPDEGDLGAALARCAEFPVSALGGRITPSGDDANPDDALRAYLDAVPSWIERGEELRAFRSSLTAEERAARGQVNVLDGGAHHALFCRSGSRRYFDQWVFFDDLWASAHRALADALFVYAQSWDPLRATRR